MRLPLRPLAVALPALVLGAALALPALAGDKPRRSVADGAVVRSQGFLSAHPDLYHRMLGLKAYDAGEHDKALMHFRKAARYADKPAQGMVAEMTWKGEGTARDPALAYAWMDLAAERGYPTMLVNREKYWKALDEAQRADAIARGAAVFAEYGDAAAKPRLESMLRRGLMQSTGSRLGPVGRSLSITLAGPGGETTIDGSQYYADKFWQPEQYWTWADTEWKQLPRGRVDIGPLETETPPLPSDPDKPAG
jgi:hypothetical protein